MFLWIDTYTNLIVHELNKKTYFDCPEKTPIDITNNIHRGIFRFYLIINIYNLVTKLEWNNF